MKPFNCAEFSTIIDINYGVASLASCVSIKNKHAPLLVIDYEEKMAQLPKLK